VGRTRVGADEVLLVQPLSFMNLCGPVVARLVREREVALSNVLVITDDFHLDLGVLRLRAGGSAGGHNGLRSLIASLGSHEFPRLRVGIGEAPQGDAERFVLTRFKPAERETIAAALDRATDAAEDWLLLGLDAAMNRHNGPAA
jgi:PTH1 family peptidyl-tRNA hydrolase